MRSLAFALLCLTVAAPVARAADRDVDLLQFDRAPVAIAPPVADAPPAPLNVGPDAQPAPDEILEPPEDVPPQDPVAAVPPIDAAEPLHETPPATSDEPSDVATPAAPVRSDPKPLPPVEAVPVLRPVSEPKKPTPKGSPKPEPKTEKPAVKAEEKAEQKTETKAEAKPAAMPVLSKDMLAPEDSLLVTVKGEPDLSGTYVVALDGTITLPLVGAVGVAGKTPAAVQKLLTEKFADGYLVNPEIAVTSGAGP